MNEIMHNGELNIIIYKFLKEKDNTCIEYFVHVTHNCIDKAYRKIIISILLGHYEFNKSFVINFKYLACFFFSSQISFMQNSMPDTSSDTLNVPVTYHGEK